MDNVQENLHKDPPHIPDAIEQEAIDWAKEEVRQNGYKDIYEIFLKVGYEKGMRNALGYKPKFKVGDFVSYVCGVLTISQGRIVCVTTTMDGTTYDIVYDLEPNGTRYLCRQSDCTEDTMTLLDTPDQ